ncbi:hypothetical protein SteCoe_437 [Stentor coeruleus]|uniref:Casein kinase I n=1 Tax=Stentor coeruleus TaxID=5963 RepID=A0A1R2D462_9CILI|nr:hypothetical protein SteCoe_437 [Stentor coeruleus]
MLNSMLENRYKVLKLLHQGENNQIFKALDTSTSGKVALKIELSENHNLILHEIQVLTDLYDLIGFPRILSQGKHKGRYYIILNYLGKSLQNKFLSLNCKFTLSCVLRLAEEFFYRIESLHKAGYIHKDLRPENVATGYGLNWQSLFLVGFTYSNKYIENNNGRHVQCFITKTLSSNVNFSSVNVMNKINPSRRDDIESIIYILIYFYCGVLPWISNGKMTEVEIKKTKESIVLEPLCKNYPFEFISCLRYVRGLEYDQEPDYEMLRSCFKDMALKNKILRVYDWALSNEKMISRARLDRSKTPSCKKTTLRQMRRTLARESRKSLGKGSENKVMEFKAKEETYDGKFGDSKDSKDNEENKDMISRMDTVISDEYPEIKNRDQIIKLRNDFLQIWIKECILTSKRRS